MTAWKGSIQPHKKKQLRCDLWLIKTTIILKTALGLMPKETRSHRPDSKFTKHRKTSSNCHKYKLLLTLFLLFVRRLDCLDVECRYFSKNCWSLMLTIVQSWQLNVILRKLPAVFLLRKRPTELCVKTYSHYNLSEVKVTDVDVVQSEARRWDLFLGDIQWAAQKGFYRRGFTAGCSPQRV